MKTIITLLLLSFCSITQAQDWPQWRGPEADSVAQEGDYPTEFSATENVLWKIALPGKGSSTPAVWGEKIFITSGDDGKDGIQCYDFAGQLVWKKTLGAERPGKHRNGSGSNPSPIVNGENVFVYYKSGTVASFSFEGELNWQINLQDEYGKDSLWWDLGTSPIFSGEQIVIAVMQESDSYVLALNQNDGSVAWKVDRNFQLKRETGQAYTTPLLTNIDGEETLVIWGADHLTGHDPSNGQRRWICKGFNPDDQPMWRVIASPAFTNGIAVIPYGRTKFLAGVKMGGEGNITETARLWTREGLGADCPTPVGRDGKVILLSDRGQLNYLDATTGEDITTAALPRSRAKFYASPILAGDLLFCAREDGVVMSIKVSDEGMELLSENDMAERLAASPVPVRDKLLIRGENHLFLIGK